MPRLSVTSEQFRHATSGKVYSVADLSVDGMGLKLIDREDLQNFALNDLVEGTINLRREKFPCRARVMRITADVVGCQFEKLPQETVDALTRFFDPKVLGSGLRPAPASGDGALWYHGPSGTDLLLWRRPDGQYHRFALFMMGSYAQWTETDGVTTGRVRSSGDDAAPLDESAGMFSLETMLLKPDYRPDSGKISIARTLLEHSALPDALKQWCVRQLERKPA